MQYKHIESALADVMSITSKDMGAFRARLRHLRNIGVPPLPNPGSGRRINYSRRRALELLIALQLEGLGQAPKNVALLAGTIVRQSPYGGKAKGGDFYAVVSESRPGVTMAFGLRAFSELMKSAPEAFLVINVSAYGRKLDPALNRAITSN